jgi:predicted 3-demethylubiquinone-9 3-methyltransferase (glyoxalase superfamily)
MAFITNLWFDTQAEQAAQFYTSVFPHSSIDDVMYYGPENPDREGTVLLVSFTVDGQKFAALNGGPQFTFDEAVSFEIRCADQTEVDHWWTTLTADGGQESQCGWLKDKFGVSWQVVPARLLELFADTDRAKAQRAMNAMLTMGKIDIAEVERAAADS